MLKYATTLVKDASYVYMIAEENNGLAKDWSKLKIHFDMRTAYKTDNSGEVEFFAPY